MKYNIFTFLTAALMVTVSTLALTSGMWIYEHNKLEAEEVRTPTTISSTMSTIYSDTQNEAANESDPTWERIEDIEEERDGGSAATGTGNAASQEGSTGD